MQDLNLPAAPLKVKRLEGRPQVFDILRNKYLIITPEEWVRQHFVHYLISELAYSKERLAIEMGIELNGLKRRCDLVYFDKQGKALMIVECKAPQIKLNQEVFDQIARYNLELKVPYLLVTNGMDHIACTMDYSKEQYVFLKEIPRAELIELGQEP